MSDFTEGCERRRFTVPEACDELFWYVADLKVEGTEATIVERDRCQDRMPIRWKPGKGKPGKADE